MRLFELEQLQEAREYLDSNIYGSWIDIETNKIIPVSKSHHWYLMKRYDIKMKPEYQDDLTDSHYQKAFEDGLVRIVHPRDSEFGKPSLEIQGSLEAVKKAWRFIRPTAMRQDAVYIDFSNSGSKEFKLPQDRAKLIQFMT